MTASTLQNLFLSIFSATELHLLGRQTQAFVRSTAISCVPFVLSLLTACTGRDPRSIATAHRAFERLAGRTVARSSFDERIASPTTVALLWRLFARVLLQGNRAERRAWPPEIQQFYDIVVEDGSSMRVGRGLADRLRSTTPGQAALKLLASLSLKQGCLTDVRLAAALHHDRALLRTTLQKGVLYLRDLGFYDHTEFAAIDTAGAFFVSLLKSTTKIVLNHVVQGLEHPEHFLGQEVTDALPWQDILDIDGVFRVAGQAPRTFRVVGIVVQQTNRHGKPLGKQKRLWWVTNLSREQASAEQVAALYRLRYASIERLFRRAKSLGALRDLQTSRMPVVMVFVLSSLLVDTLAAKVTKQLEDRWGWGEVSADRVLKVVLGWLERVTVVLCGLHPRDTAVWRQMAEQMERWGAHPNARQPTRVAEVLRVLA